PASAMRASFCSLAGLMVSKYFPDFGFCHLPLMKSSYCCFSAKWSVDSGAGARAQSKACFLVLVARASKVDVPPHIGPDGRSGPCPAPLPPAVPHLPARTAAPILPSAAVEKEKGLMDSLTQMV